MLKILTISEYLGGNFHSETSKNHIKKFEGYLSDTDTIDSIQIWKHKNRYPIRTVNRYPAL